MNYFVIPSQFWVFIFKCVKTMWTSSNYFFYFVSIQYFNIGTSGLRLVNTGTCCFRVTPTNQTTTQNILIIEYWCKCVFQCMFQSVCMCVVQIESWFEFQSFDIIVNRTTQLQCSVTYKTQPNRCTIASTLVRESRQRNPPTSNAK